MPPTMTKRAKESKLALVDHKSLCVKECLHIMYGSGPSPDGESDQAGGFGTYCKRSMARETGTQPYLSHSLYVMAVLQ